MLVLVTRPRPQAEATAEALRELGHEALIDPVLTIRPRPLPSLDAADHQAVLLTSVRAAELVPASLRELPAFAVGAATAAAARAAGSISVHEGPGNGAQLAALIARTIDRDAGALLHLAGDEVRPGLAGILREAGFDYRRVTAYVAEPVGRLSADTLAALASGRCHGVLFFSPRSAALWAGLIEASGMSGMLGATAAFCLSAAVAEPLRPLPFSKLVVGPAPTEVDLLRCLAAPGG